MKSVTCLLVLAVLGLCTTAAIAEAPKVNQTVVVKNLDNPCGVAVQPGTGHVFVADSAAGRVIRVSGDGHEDVITGFPKDTYGKGTYEEGTKFDIGPLGLAFVDKNTLVVGGGGLKDGGEIVRVYAVPEPGKSITADMMKFKAGPIAAGDDSAEGEGNFYGVAADARAIYITCNGDDTKGWVSKVGLGDSEHKLAPFIKTKQATGVDAPVGITISGDGYLVIAQMGEITVAGDSLLTFYDANDGKLLTKLPTGLHDIAGLAYSPRHKRLYAVDFAWGENAKDGGLYRLDGVTENGKQVVKTVKLAALDKPTAVAFAPNNDCYVTVIGTPEKGSNEKPGRLIRITGDL